MTCTPYSGEVAVPFGVAVADWLQLCSAGLRLSSISTTSTRPTVLTAVNRDPDLTGEQRLALEELYAAFCELNRGRRSES